jgi:hypothetical protein
MPLSPLHLPFGCGVVDTSLSIPHFGFFEGLQSMLGWQHWILHLESFPHPSPLCPFLNQVSDIVQLADFLSSLSSPVDIPIIHLCFWATTFDAVKPDDNHWQTAAETLFENFNMVEKWSFYVHI